MSLIKVSDQTNLVETSRFPHGKYPFEFFNQVQSRVFEIYDKNCNCVIAAPTSVGKTICAEMFMSHEARVRGGKAIYLAPLKALAKEKIDDWLSEKSLFSDLKISICTGDYRLTEARMKELNDADVIVMTSEMLNSRCRNLQSENNEFLRNCGTLVVDESHLLTVPSRGDHLEVGLMKFSQIARDPRIVFLSATMPNVDQIANWVGCSLVKKDTYLVHSEYRPCPLEIHYDEYETGESYDLTEEYKASSAVDLIKEHKDDKFLVFVHSKATGERIRSALEERGVVCELHNADLDKDKRHKVEQKFKSGDLRVIVATSTLAWGCYKHGSRVILPDGSMKDVADISVGDKLLCPVGAGFSPKKVVKEKTFKADRGYFVKLECGDTMTVSEDHVFLSAKGRNAPDWNEISSLSKGDFIAVPSDFGLWPEKIADVDRFWYLAGFAFGDGCISDCGAHADGTQKALLDLCLGKRGSLSDKVVQMFSDEFGHTPVVRDDANGVPHISTKKKRIVDRFLAILPLGRKNGDDDIPREAYASQLSMRSFLRGLFDADGGAEDHSNGNVSVGFSNISEKAVQSVRSSLLGFGIRSSFGRKRMKPSTINGRLQMPVRKYSYRLRIFGAKNLGLFIGHVGFNCPEKHARVSSYLAAKPSDNPKDLVPARGLLKEHLLENGLKVSCFKSITNCDLYNSLNSQDCKRKTLLKLFSSSPKRTRLNDLVEKPYFWSRIKEIRKCKGGLFKEIEIEDPHAYVGCGAISHNCNFPARRVIIAGVHRGRTEVETYDIFQMAGRAGRPGYDPKGDVHILLPYGESDHHIDRLSTPKNIESQLLSYVGQEEDPRYKTLAFHLVSDIHYGQIKTIKDVHDWYSKSLAYFQYEDLDDSIVDKTIDLLTRVGAIKEVDGNYEATSVGKVSSIMYYSPFDVADLRRNFRILFSKGLDQSDFALSLALGNVDTIRAGFVTRAEKDEMGDFASKVYEAHGSEFPESAIKGAYAYYCLLNGNQLGPFAAFARGLQMDAERLISVLSMLDSMAAKWNKKDFFNAAYLRIMYGVRPELIDLCKIPNIGKVRAEKLYAAGFRKPPDLFKNPHLVKRLLNMKDEKIQEIMNSIKSIS
jgi:replicative superfamily II helicase